MTNYDIRGTKVPDVNARQRPGGVAWDAGPLTVRGLNKAAGNPPLKLVTAVARAHGPPSGISQP